MLQGASGPYRSDMAGALRGRLRALQADLRCAALHFVGDSCEGGPQLKELDLDSGPLHFVCSRNHRLGTPEALQEYLTQVLSEELAKPKPAAPQPTREARASKEVEDSPHILVEGIPDSWQETQVKMAFVLYGGVAAVRFANQARGGRAAKVWLKSPENMAKAVKQLHGSKVGDGELIQECKISCRVVGQDLANQRSSRTLYIDELDMSSRPADLQPGKNDREVFLQSLPVKDCTEEQIHDWLQGFGEIEEMNLLRQGEASAPSGKGYVRFCRHDGAAACVEAQASVADAEQPDGGEPNGTGSSAARPGPGAAALPAGRRTPGLGLDSTGATLELGSSMAAERGFPRVVLPRLACLFLHGRDHRRLLLQLRFLRLQLLEVRERRQHPQERYRRHLRLVVARQPVPFVDVARLGSLRHGDPAKSAAAFTEAEPRAAGSGVLVAPSSQQLSARFPWPRLKPAASRQTSFPAALAFFSATQARFSAFLVSGLTFGFTRCLHRSTAHYLGLSPRQAPPGSFYAHPCGRALGPPPGLAAPCCRTAEGPWAPGAWEGAPSTRCSSRESTRAPCASAAIADSGSDSDGPGARLPPGAWSSQGEGGAPRPPGCFGGAGCGHELGKPGVPSAGSAQHHLGLCRPCDFVYRGACREGTSCRFCHLCGPDEVQRRKKEQRRQHRAQQRAVARA
ncbi:unnamed protein product [Prorocentrum cordatum]|uniref:RRM domain-containing protein n=1 Tax=Prorocentrum cordatum TaxID=2364126 RepID=A0ABN9XNR7_9DINO|nr:unnamed protein product [Polarella glacialis]